MIALVVLLAGCGEGPWTSERALRPTLARLDHDGDGSVDAAEYGLVSFSGPAFAAIDLDADARLSIDELAALEAGLDPITFYTAPRLPAGTVMGGMAGPGGPEAGGPEDEGAAPVSTASRAEREEVRWVLLALREEVLAADPAADLPDVREFERVSDLGRIDSAPVRELLVKLEAASVKAGLAFPAGLTSRAAGDRPSATP